MTTLSESAQQPGDLALLAGKYLTFELGEQTHGVGILKVQKIIKVPHTPDYVKGVINLRGKVIPA